MSFGGLFIALLSCSAFAQGTYLWYVLGAFLFFVAGLFDEMDGMLACIKFADSPFGTWLEGFIDGASYLLLFAGTAVGLYKQHGRSELLVGAALSSLLLLPLLCECAALRLIARMNTSAIFINFSKKTPRIGSPGFRARFKHS